MTSMRLFATGFSIALSLSYLAACDDKAADESVPTSVQEAVAPGLPVQLASTCVAGIELRPGTQEDWNHHGSGGVVGAEGGVCVRVAFKTGSPCIEGRLAATVDGSVVTVEALEHSDGKGCVATTGSVDFGGRISGLQPGSYTVRFVRNGKTFLEKKADVR